MADFLATLSKALVSDRGVSESTANLYLRTLLMLNDKKPFSTLAFLKKRDAIASKLETYADSTKKGILAAIVSMHTKPLQGQGNLQVNLQALLRPYDGQV